MATVIKGGRLVFLAVSFLWLDLRRGKKCRQFKVLPVYSWYRAAVPCRNLENLGTTMRSPESTSLVSHAGGFACSFTSTTPYGKCTASDGPGGKAPVSLHQSPGVRQFGVSLVIMRSVSRDTRTMLSVESWNAVRRYDVCSRGFCT